jgi:flavin reductase (DIM6/NTAB) family NADH-FMN oxidoreductase RutF
MKIDPASLDARNVHDLLVGCVLPRPIAFVSTIGKDGVYNAAPFSFYTILSLHPALIGFTVGRRRGGIKKDTLVNIEFAGEFVINVVPESIAEAMNKAAGDYPSDVDEFVETGLTPVQSDLVRPPRVAESPIQLECRLMQILEFGALPTTHNFIIGEVLRVHVQNELVVDGVVQSDRVKAVGRLGAELYCRTREIFEMKRVRVPPRS